MRSASTLWLVTWKNPWLKQDDLMSLAAFSVATTSPLKKPSRSTTGAFSSCLAETASSSGHLKLEGTWDCFCR
ncbi:hypothetical protein GBA52_001372 [Prunus armeniaca]|nr:hypothetical protein GBA52_001372 [Prunus armeniaca]